MSGQRSYLICYDIADPKRLHKVERIMSGFGYRLQESVFYCTLGNLLLAKMRSEISNTINREHDQWMLIDLGDNPNALDEFETIGKKLIKIPKITFI